MWVLPEVLHHAQLRIPPLRDDSFYKLPVPGKNPTLWGTSAADDAWADAMGRSASGPHHPPVPRWQKLPSATEPRLAPASSEASEPPRKKARLAPPPETT